MLMLMLLLAFINVLRKSMPMCHLPLGMVYQNYSKKIPCHSKQTYLINPFLLKFSYLPCSSFKYLWEHLIIIALKELMKFNN